MGGFCILAYLTFGTSIHPNVLTNIGLDFYGQSMDFPAWIRTATNATLAFRFLFIMPAFMPPIFLIFDSMLECCLRVDLSEALQLESVFQLLPRRGGKFSICLLSRSLSYVTLLVWALFFAHALGAVITICGSLFQSMNVIIIPCAAYLKLCTGSFCKKALVCLMLSVGLIWCLVGTYVGVSDIFSQEDSVYARTRFA